MLYALWCRLCGVSDYLLDVVVAAGVVHHVEDGDERVLFGVAEGAAVDEVVAPHVQPPEALQLALLAAHQQAQTARVLLLRQQPEQAAGERAEVVVQGHVVYEQVQVLTLLDHSPVEIVESVDRTVQPLLVRGLLAALEVDEVKPEQL